MDFDILILNIFLPDIDRRLPEWQHLFVFGRLLLSTYFRPLLESVEASVLSDIRTTSTPTNLHQIIAKAVLTVFYTAQSEAGAFDEWIGCKNNVRVELVQSMIDLDPTVEFPPQKYHKLREQMTGNFSWTGTSFSVVATAVLLCTVPQNVNEEDAAAAHPLFRYFHQWLITVSFLMETASRITDRTSYKRILPLFLNPAELWPWTPQCSSYISSSKTFLQFMTDSTPV